jgi:hypothetical protein
MYKPDCKLMVHAINEINKNNIEEAKKYMLYDIFENVIVVYPEINVTKKYNYILETIIKQLKNEYNHRIKILENECLSTFSNNSIIDVTIVNAKINEIKAYTINKLNKHIIDTANICLFDCSDENDLNFLLNNGACIHYIHPEKKITPISYYAHNNPKLIIPLLKNGALLNANYLLHNLICVEPSITKDVLNFKSEAGEYIDTSIIDYKGYTALEYAKLYLSLLNENDIDKRRIVYHNIYLIEFYMKHNKRDTHYITYDLINNGEDIQCYNIRKK